MIKRFHALYVGQIDLDNVGLQGTPANERRYSNDRFAEVFEWLTLNHGALDVFLHPNTGDSLRDHRDAAVWIGHSHKLMLDIFTS